MLADRRPPPRSFEVWQENLDCVVLFRRLETQWRKNAGFAGTSYQGLIYSEAIALMKERHIKPKRRVELLDDLAQMERAALPILNGAEDEADG